jgi:ribosome-associated protein
MGDEEANPTNEPLRLDQFLKLRALSGTGGQAKVMIQSGDVKVNGQVETRRRRKLSVGDVVEVGGAEHRVTAP